MIHRVLRSFRLFTVLAVMLVATTLVPPGAAFARDLGFQASIVDRQGNLLTVRTSGNEVLQLDLGWFKNKGGYYPLVRDETFCFEVNELANGKLMVTSVVTCAESEQDEDEDKKSDEQRNEPK